MLRFLVLCVFSSVVFGTTLYVSEGGTDTSSCSSNSPCGSLSVAIAVFGDSTTDLTIKFDDGDFFGPENSNIEFPDVYITLEPNSSDEIPTFSCSDEEEDTAFIIKSNLNMNLINLKNCKIGISFTGDTIQVQNSHFINNAISIDITAATSLEIKDCIFEGRDKPSIILNYHGDMEKIEISTSDFINSGVLFILGADNTVKPSITKSVFNNTRQASSIYAIELTEAAWTLTDVTCINVNTCVYYIGVGENAKLDVNEIEVVGENGISFDALAPLDIEGGYFDTSKTAVYISAATTVEIEESVTIIESLSPIVIRVVSPIEIEISQVTFNFTGPCLISVPDLTNAKITNCAFYDPLGALVITGGSWGISNVLIQQDVFSLFPSSGGAFSLSGDGATFTITNCDFWETAVTGSGGAIYISGASVAFEDCSFNNCFSGAYGGAVYAENFAGLSFKSCSFENNTSVLNGGGIDLEFDESGGPLVHMKDVSFTGNEALNGAAVSCCSISVCNITLVYNSESTIVLSNNENSIGNSGSDVTCKTTIGPFENAAIEPDVDISPKWQWWSWLLLSFLIFVILALIILAAASALFVAKRRQRVDYQLD